MGHSEFEDSYDDKREIKGAILTETIQALKPAKPIAVRPQASVHSAVREMNEHRCGCVCVTDDHGRLVGVFTERDVLRKVAEHEIDSHRTPVSEVMTRRPETLASHDKIAYALNKMHVGGFRHIPIVDQGKLTGVISIKDIATFLVALFPESVLNVPSDPSLEVPKTPSGG